MLTKAASSSLGCSSGHENRSKLTAGAGRLVYRARPAYATAGGRRANTWVPAELWQVHVIVVRAWYNPGECILNVDIMFCVQ